MFVKAGFKCLFLVQRKMKDSKTVELKRGEIKLCI